MLAAGLRGGHAWRRLLADKLLIPFGLRARFPREPGWVATVFAGRAGRRKQHSDRADR
jgi:hypothetical protein